MISEDKAVCLGLEVCDPEETYMAGDLKVRCWIGAKWDIAEDKWGRFHIYRKGNWMLDVGSFDLACAIVADDLDVSFASTIKQSPKLMGVGGQF